MAIDQKELESSPWPGLAANGRLPSVILLDGVGAEKHARMLGALWLCDAGSACGICGSCLAWMNDQHPDGLWIDREDARIKLEDAAEVQEHLSYNPSSSAGRRLVVLERAEMLTIQAANRLLKTLEEPPEFAVIILTTVQAGKLLDTILSRCMRWRLPKELEGAEVQLTEAQRGLLERLLLEERVGDQLALAEQITKEHKMGSLEIIEKAEVVLNQLYRNGTLSEGHARRRRQLGQMRQIARAQVPLNAQMVAEQIGNLYG